ncbi:MAG: hypothetical protein RL338_128 [Chloroflexota bacterium]
MNDRLYRTRDDRILGGVAAGVADYIGIDPTFVRIAWGVLGLFSGGVLLVLYVVMWIVVPEEPLETSEVVVAAGTVAGAPAAATPAAAAPAAVTAPTSREAARARRRAERARARAEGRGGSGGLIAGLVLIAIGGWFLIDEYLPGIDLDRAWPLLIIGLGVIVIAGAIRPRSTPPGPPAPPVPPVG